MKKCPEIVTGAGAPEPLGASVVQGCVNFAVYSESAQRIWVCIFEDEVEIACIELNGRQGHVHYGLITGVGFGARYGLRAEGAYDPNQGLFFDPDKLLVDPYATEIDRAYCYDPRFSMGREKSWDTANLVPKGIVRSASSPGLSPVKNQPGGLIYEINTRGFTKLHPDVPKEICGTVAALGHPSVVAHLVELGVDTLELMPLAAFIDERHLVTQGLANAWGYNPVSYFATDPKLMPGGMAELRKITDIYRAHGIGVIVDVVYNHTGESDIGGPVLSFRGLDALTYYRHDAVGDGVEMINDTGCGNTLQCDHPAVQQLVLDSLVHWVTQGCVSGFRFDLAPILGRNKQGFSPDAALISAINNHPVLAECTLIAEPWDPGPGGYQLGQFGPEFLEWNDKYRDDVRRYWRGDNNTLGALATRLSGSSDVFNRLDDRPGRGVNFLAAHDGFTLHDLVSFEHKHNLANGENNRDGHGENLSWNCGVEGASEDIRIVDARNRDVRALLATLFMSRGNLMLTAGDELGRSQRGNNNAYAQDNETTWLDWAEANRELAGFVGDLAKFRKQHRSIFIDQFLVGDAPKGQRDVVWWHPQGREMRDVDWHQSQGDVLGMHLNIEGDEVLVWFNRAHENITGQCPDLANGLRWQVGMVSSMDHVDLNNGLISLPARSVVVLVVVNPEI